MNARFRIVLATAAVCIGVSASTAQDFDYEIRLTNGERYANVALVELGGDTLHFLHKKNFPDWVLLDSLTEIRRERTGAILPATIIGGAGGGAIGEVATAISRGSPCACASTTSKLSMSFTVTHRCGDRAGCGFPPARE
ncbi:hypothetical protein FBQ87_02970 [Sphingobacteriales bacterium CHB3]|nr:hypothetical protein [Sphingobacteriales bacterium CHB3]